MDLKCISFLFAAGVAMAVEKPGDDPLQWLRDSIPGEPGVDYPIFSAVEDTGFSCEGKVFGGEFVYLETIRVREINRYENRRRGIFCPLFN